jgi:septal ring factor EnvC (AmiA/AmiB activator)
MVRRLILAAFATAVIIAVTASGAQTGGSDIKTLAVAKREAGQANFRSQQLERQAANATGQAARARADAALLAARIEAAEAAITTAETRMRIIEVLRARQRARLAERQEPVVRLTAALETMARRPPALALVQPGSLQDLVHVRALLASTLPVIRERTAALRDEVEAGNVLREQADRAVASLVSSREELKHRRIQLASFERDQLQRSQSLSESALWESDRALALGEEVRALSAEMGTLDYQARLRQRLAALPGPLLRPALPGETPPSARVAPERPRYIIPVEGRLVTGMGEISDAGVHARGLTFQARRGAPIVAPAAGRVVYAGRFRSYGNIVIIDHGAGWTSAITDVGTLSVRAGDKVRMRSPLGAAADRSLVTVELRRGGEPIPIAPLLSIG